MHQECRTSIIGVQSEWAKGAPELVRHMTECKRWQSSERCDLCEQVDPVFEGLDGGEGSLIKYNPLSNMSGAETWNFLRVMVSTSARSK